MKIQKIISPKHSESSEFPLEKKMITKLKNKGKKKKKARGKQLVIPRSVSNCAGKFIKVGSKIWDDHDDWINEMMQSRPPKRWYRFCSSCWCWYSRDFAKIAKGHKSLGILIMIEDDDTPGKWVRKNAICYNSFFKGAVVMPRFNTPHYEISDSELLNFDQIETELESLECKVSLNLRRPQFGVKEAAFCRTHGQSESNGSTK